MERKNEKRAETEERMQSWNNDKRQWVQRVSTTVKMHRQDAPIRGRHFNTILQLPVPYVYAFTARTDQTISSVTITGVSIKFVKCQTSTVEKLLHIITF